MYGVRCLRCQDFRCQNYILLILYADSHRYSCRTRPSHIRGSGIATVAGRFHDSCRCRIANRFLKVVIRRGRREEGSSEGKGEGEGQGNDKQHSRQDYIEMKRHTTHNMHTTHITHIIHRTHRHTDKYTNSGTKYHPPHTDLLVLSFNVCWCSGWSQLSTFFPAFFPPLPPLAPPPPSPSPSPPKRSSSAASAAPRVAAVEQSKAVKHLRSYLKGLLRSIFSG